MPQRLVNSRRRQARPRCSEGGPELKEGTTQYTITHAAVHPGDAAGPCCVVVVMTARQRPVVGDTRREQFGTNPEPGCTGYHTASGAAGSGEA
jgi:hypothetical protein